MLGRIPRAGMLVCLPLSPIRLPLVSHRHRMLGRTFATPILICVQLVCHLLPMSPTGTGCWDAPLGLDVGTHPWARIFICLPRVFHVSPICLPQVPDVGTNLWAPIFT